MKTILLNKRPVSKGVLLISGILLISLSCSKHDVVNPPHHYCEIYINPGENPLNPDVFKVKFFVGGSMPSSNSIFQFPATVPGTYSIENFGSYVTNFSAFDKQNNPLQTNKISTNQWEIEKAQEAYLIEYDVTETGYSIWAMEGTAIEDDYAVLNTFAVVGYPAALANYHFVLNLQYPAGWELSTSLPKNSSGYLEAENYNALADAPILLGDLTTSSMKINGAQINVAVHSLNGNENAQQLLTDINGVTTDLKAFLGSIPVDHYNFLFNFDKYSFGALEHNFSSLYVLAANNYSSNAMQDIAAHEFFHTVTPLHIHSNVIQNFNFQTPTPSRLVWFYEGVTEWASWIMRYRNKSITPDYLLTAFKNKIKSEQWAASNYNPYLSLDDLGIHSYEQEGSDQFSTVYNRGALVAMLLDIRILELSDGKKGLRDVIVQLMAEYGSNSYFDDNQFYNILVNKTFPEINDFINTYIKGTNPLPLSQYFSSIGVLYSSVDNSLTVSPNMTPSQQKMFDAWSKN